MRLKVAIKETINNLIFAHFGQNTREGLIFALMVFAVLVVLLQIFHIYILAYLKKFSKKSKTKLDDTIIEFLQKISWKFYILIALYAAVKYLTLTPLIDKIINYMMFIVVVYYGAKFLNTLIGYFAERQISKAIKEDENEDTTLITVLGKIFKAIVWILAALMLLSNLGFNITSLIAGLGIGGIAIAFALQNILEDLFSSFTIYFDKPFKKGDFIVIGQDMGVIKNIGIKSTRIQTLQGQELIVSNKELTNTRINNYKRMEKRRIVFSFGVEYGTSISQLKKINSIVSETIKKIKLSSLDRVHFKEFGPSSLNYEVVYYLNSNDYNKYMDTQQEINFELKKRFEKEKISMAFPTQTVYLRKE